MNKRDLRLKKYGITQYRYRELKYFCRQYKEKLQQLNSICSISSIKYGIIGSNTPSKRTEEEAEKRVELEKDIKIIEDSIKEASEEFYDYIMQDVCFGISYDNLDIPLGRTAYFEIRKNFFLILSKKKK